MPAQPLVYVVDDNPDDFLLLQEAWRESGVDCDLRHFPVGVSLLDRIDLLPVPSLAIVDVNLPAVGGRAIVAKMRADARYQAVPVVMCSSAANPNERDLSEKAGADGFFTKPTVFDEYLPFVRAMNDLIHAGGNRPPRLAV